jgi:hypothetical protein
MPEIIPNIIDLVHRAALGVTGFVRRSPWIAAAAAAALVMLLLA